MNNRDRLIDIMIENELDRLEIADLLKVKHDEVNKWLASVESKNCKAMPDMAIELLELKVKAKVKE